MFVSSTEYLNEVSRLIRSGKPVSLAIAFIGVGAEELLASARAEVRLICNLLSGGTNPDAVELIRQLPHVKVMHRPDLHAKVLVSDSEAIVGSANLSANGLGFAENCEQRLREAGVLVHDQSQITKIDAWFEETWRGASEISPADMDLARKRWRARSATRRVSQAAGERLLDVPVEDLDGLPIYVALYTGNASEKADRAASAQIKKVARKEQRTDVAKKLSFFEGWPDLPVNAAPLLCFWYSPRYALYPEGVWERAPVWDTSYVEDGYDRGIQMVTPCESVMGWSYGASGEKAVARLLRPVMPKLLKLGHESGAVCVSLHDALKIAGT